MTRTSLTVAFGLLVAACGQTNEQAAPDTASNIIQLEQSAEEPILAFNTREDFVECWRPDGWPAFYPPWDGTGPFVRSTDSIYSIPAAENLLNLDNPETASRLAGTRNIPGLENVTEPTFGAATFIERDQHLVNEAGEFAWGNGVERVEIFASHIIQHMTDGSRIVSTDLATCRVR